MQKKREIFFGLGSNLRLFDKIVRVNLDKPLENIEQAKNGVPEISPMFEPKEKGLTEAQMDTFYSQNPTLLASVSALRTFFLETEEEFEPIFL